MADRVTPEELHDWHRDRHGLDNDPTELILARIIWVALGVCVVLFWAGFLMTGLPFVVTALDATWTAVETAGALNGCQTLNLLPGECAAWAQEGGW